MKESKPTTKKNVSKTDTWFDPNFDQELNDSQLQSCQEMIGCFECGDPNPTKTCSRCKVAKYCSQECQKTDWKKSHKQLCNIIVNNKKSRSNDPNAHDPGVLAPMPILLRSVGLMSDSQFEEGLQKRRQLFFQKVKENRKPIPMEFSMAIVPLFQKLRLVITPSFTIQHHHCSVPDLFVAVVDEDKDSHHLEQWEQTQGEITNHTLQVVVDQFEKFYTELEDTKMIFLQAITCGSGLYNRLDQLEEKLHKKGISGLVFVPTEHMLED